MRATLAYDWGEGTDLISAESVCQTPARFKEFLSDPSEVDYGYITFEEDGSVLTVMPLSIGEFVASLTGLAVPRGKEVRVAVTVCEAMFVILQAGRVIRLLLQEATASSEWLDLLEGPVSNGPARELSRIMSLEDLVAGLPGTNVRQLEISFTSWNGAISRLASQFARIVQLS